MYHKLVSSIAGVVIALAVAGTVAFAASETGSTAQGGAADFGTAVTGTVTGTTPLTGQAKLAAVIAAKFDVSPTEVMTVRAGTGWGNVFKIFLLAQLSGKSTTEILAARETGGWGTVYKSLGVKPGKKENLGQAIKASKAPTSTTTLTQTVPSNAKGNKPAVPPGLNKPADQGNGKPEKR